MRTVTCTINFKTSAQKEKARYETKTLWPYLFPSSDGFVYACLTFSPTIWILATIAEPAEEAMEPALLNGAVMMLELKMQGNQFACSGIDVMKPT